MRRKYVKERKSAMDHEYKRDERLIGNRLTLNPGGSSARLVREDEIDPAELRRKVSECSGTDSRYMDMFCERYRDRGIAGRVHADAARQEKREALDRAGTPGSYISADRLAKESKSKEEQLDVYRSGVSDGRRYMTADDFTRYYHDQRGYKFPQYRVATDAERVAAVKAVAPIREMRLTQPKKAGWLTDTDKLPKFLRGLMKKPAFVWLNEWAGETFPRVSEEDESRHAPVRTRRIPVGLTAALVAVVVSMSMVITGTVLVSQSTNELSRQKDKLAELQEVHGELSDELALKNDALHIEERAREELGMVSEKYLHGEYIIEERTDELEILDRDRDEKKSGFARLLSAFGIGN